MHEVNKDIHFIITGGTIDSVFDTAKDTVVPGRASQVYNFIKHRIQPNVKISDTVVSLKDSREITDNVREEIWLSIQKATTNSIVVTHGTYTMGRTAKFLQQKLDELIEDFSKTVVLTGSMLPINGFVETDAPYNLGYATAMSQSLKPGIYTAMSSTIFKADEVIKDIDHARFVYKD